MKTVLFVAFALTAGLAVAQKQAPPKATPEPLTLNFSDMPDQKHRVLDLVDSFNRRTDEQDTALYAADYHRMLKRLETVGVKHFTADELKQVYSVAEPTTGALILYAQERRAVAEQQTVRKQEIEEELVRLAEVRRAKAEAEAKQKQFEQAVELKKAEIAARERQAAATESLAVSAARAAQQPIIVINR